MNLYVRYFDHETFATNMDDVVDFLTSIREIKVTDDMLARVDEFLLSDNTFPFRLKVNYSNYVLFLKTDAQDMEEFKILEQQRKALREEGRMTAAEKKRLQLETLNEPNSGWYEAQIVFKRVMMDVVTAKCSYVDTVFKARLRADSAMDCYNRVIDYLQSRTDIDPRSQFPSPKNINFEYTFLGEDIESEPEQEQESEPEPEDFEQEA